MLAKLQGFFCPIMTPFDGDLNVDAPALRRLVERVIAAGAHGIFALGTTGEGYQLLDDQKRQVVDLVIEPAAGRVPVIAGIGDMSTRRMIALARRLTRSGLDGFVAIPPLGTRRLSQQELHDHFTQIADAVDLPVAVYVNPSLTGHFLDADSIARLADHPRIVGLKDSTGDFAHFSMVLRAAGGRRDFGILQGHEWLLDASMLMGADGLVCGSGTLAAELPVKIIEAARKGDRAEAARLQQRLISLLRIYGPRLETVISGQKYALSRLGLCQPFCLAPTQPLDDAARARIDAVLREEEML